jgi:hypothetical protein
LEKGIIKDCVAQQSWLAIEDNEDKGEVGQEVYFADDER